MITTRSVKVTNYSRKRETPIRSFILAYFKEADYPLDYSQIALRLSENGLVANKSTIYRQINSMVLARIITELDFGEGKKRYELKKDRHHHLICTSCDRIFCIDATEDLTTVERQILDSTNFKITDYSLEYFGTCEICRSV